MVKEAISQDMSNNGTFGMAPVLPLLHPFLNLNFLPHNYVCAENINFLISFSLINCTQLKQEFRDVEPVLTNTNTDDDTTEEHPDINDIAECGTELRGNTTNHATEVPAHESTLFLDKQVFVTFLEQNCQVQLSTCVSTKTLSLFFLNIYSN